VQTLAGNGSGVVQEQFVLELHIVTEQETVGDERIVELVRSGGYFGSGGIVPYVQLHFVQVLVVVMATKSSVVVVV
jgi:hypothetical protein